MKYLISSLPRLFISRFLIFLTLLLSFATPAIASEPWLGVGLGFNVYFDKDDVTDLGPAWVYNWGGGGEFTASYAQDQSGYFGNNLPNKDFPSQYVPAIYDCQTTTVNDVLDWIETHDYVGPLLVFNEPDNQTYSSCSRYNGDIGNLTNAVNRVHEIIAWRDAYYAETGNYIDLILGGTYWTPTSDYSWLKLFGTQWQQTYGTTWPNVEGLHFHVYVATENGGTDLSTTAVINNFKSSLDAATTYLNSRSYMKGTKDSVWITEMGVLDATFSTTSINTIMDGVLPYYKANTMLDRVAWFAFSLHKNGHPFNWMKNTALMNPDTQVKNPAYYTFQDYCINQGYCTEVPIQVKDTTVTNNLISDNHTSNYACNYGNWCKWKRNSGSDAVIMNTGDLKIVSDPTTSGYGACWLQWLDNAPANGSVYQIKANYHSNYPSNTSTILLQTLGGDNYNEQPWWYTTGVTNLSMDHTLPVYDRFGGNVAIKFCSYGQTATEEVEATLRNLSVKKISAPVVDVKDTSVANNLIKNDRREDGACEYGKWCAWHRDNNLNTNITKINAASKLVIGANSTSGNFGTCWIQWVQGGVADGSTYRVKANADSNFATNKSSVQIQTYTNEAYKIFYTNGTNASIDQTFTITDAVNPNFISIKYCSWGTNTSAATATLKKISIEKL